MTIYDGTETETGSWTGSKAWWSTHPEIIGMEFRAHHPYPQVLAYLVNGKVHYEIWLNQTETTGMHGTSTYADGPTLRKAVRNLAMAALKT